MGYYAKFRKKSRRKKDACYVATAVYGSYDCPQVWTLRRYRDDYLKTNIRGRIFIRVYYAISPIIIKMFGKTDWFNRICKRKLDVFVEKLNKKGYSNDKYYDN